MESIQKVLREKYQNSVGKYKQPRKRARIQVMADRLHQKLGFGENYQHYAILVRICKNNKEAHIARAVQYLADYPNMRNPLGLFMWKLKEIRNESKSISKSKADNTETES